MSAKIAGLLLIVTLALFTEQLNAQRQLVLLKRESVVLRLQPGDDFVYRLKNNKTVYYSYVNNLSDTAVVAHNSVVPFHTIDRFYFQQSTFYNRVGAGLVAGGILLFLIDQLNNSIIKGNKFSFDRGVSTASLALVGIGLPMVLFKKKSQPIGYKYRFLSVKKGSIFYKEDPRGFSSPYIPGE